MVADLPDDAATALLVGHNPGVAQLVGILSGADAEMRTASVAVLAWTGRWSDVAAHIASLEQHTTARWS